MYSIDNIPMKDYGLHISGHKGQLDHVGLKNMLFTIYGTEGYQITKRKGNVLQLRGFIMATNMTAFQNQIAQLKSALNQPGSREIVFADENETIECFAKDGFKITNVRTSANITVGMIQMNLTVIDVVYATPSTGVFSSQFTSVFGGASSPEPSSGIFSSAFNSTFN